MQARMSQDDNRLYSPNRDVAHNFEQVIMEVASRCEAHKWTALNTLAYAHKISDEDLGRACQALCLFMSVQADHPGEGMASCLARSGFFELPEASRIIVCAHLGSIMLGIHWAGVREATLGGKGPALTYKKLRHFGKAFALAMSMPRWRRTFYFLQRRARKAWRILTNAGKSGD